MNAETIAAVGMAGLAAMFAWSIYLSIRVRRVRAGVHALNKTLVVDLADACDRLNALRKSAYLRNSKGHLVRYTDAPAEVRERAETN